VTVRGPVRLGHPRRCPSTVDPMARMLAITVETVRLSAPLHRLFGA
jgi:hypothetical protein